MKEIMQPRDPRDQKSVVLEIRPGTERRTSRTLFAGRFVPQAHTPRPIAKMGSRAAVADRDEGAARGSRRETSAAGSVRRLKYESGVHPRYKRVP